MPNRFYDDDMDWMSFVDDEPLAKKEKGRFVPTPLLPACSNAVNRGRGTARAKAANRGRPLLRPVTYRCAQGAPNAHCSPP